MRCAYLPLIATNAANYASCFTISLPLYVPQALQTLCERLYSPHLGHFVMPGRSSFQTLERLLSRLAFDTFLFGTAMLPHLQLMISAHAVIDKFNSAIAIGFSGSQAAGPLLFYRNRNRPHSGFYRIYGKDRGNPPCKVFSTAFRA